jgi:hypothetical protein
MAGEAACGSRVFRTRLLGLFLVSLLALLLAGDLLARTDKWKRQNDRGNRFEGRIEIPVGKPDLELLSFVGFREPFTGEVTLKVRFFLPTDAPVFIQARELQEDKHYWMESKRTSWRPGTWNDFGPWSTRDVLTREDIAPSNLGIVIRLHRDTGNGGEVLPAFVYHSTPPATFTRYTLHLRPTSTLKKVTYALSRIVDEREVGVKASSLLGEKIAGEPFPIELDARNLPDGPLRLVVQGEYKNREGGPLREYTFHHKLRLR